MVHEKAKWFQRIHLATILISTSTRHTLIIIIILHCFNTKSLKLKDSFIKQLTLQGEFSSQNHEKEDITTPHIKQ
jgi:hypothetical protein